VPVIHYIITWRNLPYLINRKIVFILILMRFVIFIEVQSIKQELEVSLGSKFNPSIRIDHPSIKILTPSWKFCSNVEALIRQCIFLFTVDFIVREIRIIVIVLNMLLVHWFRTNHCLFELFISLWKKNLKYMHCTICFFFNFMGYKH